MKYTFAPVSVAVLFAVASTGAFGDLFAKPEPWETVGGRWVIGNGRAEQTDPAAIAFAYLPVAVFGDVAAEVRFKAFPEGDGVRAAGLILRATDPLHAYFVHFDTRNDQVILFRGDPRREGHEIARVRGVGLEAGRWHTARAEIAATGFRIRLDGRILLSASDATHPAGAIGVYASQGRVQFRALRVEGASAQLDTPWEPAMYQPDVPRAQPLAEILDIKVIAKQPGRFIGWPSIAQAANGDLIAVFSGDRSAHISPDGILQMVRSVDGGATWTEPETIFDTPIDDRDAGIVVTRTGALLVSWFTNPGGGEWQGHWVIRSTDHGHTWGAPVRTEVTTPHGPIQLGDGRLLFVGQRPHESHGDPCDVAVQESRDDGLTWQTIGVFPVPEGEPVLAYDECHAVERADGSILLAFRDCYEPHRMRQSVSVDGGRIWAPPRATAVHGYPPHLLRLADDRLLVVYAKRWAPLGQYACVSRDGGETWDTEREILLASAFDGDIGYPASVQIGDGTIWTVYYQAEQPGEQPCLMATHWRLKE